jgi:superfamily II DNA helicase RecQ
MALTATANEQTIGDIVQRLEFKKDHAFYEQSFNRTNLSYTVSPKKKKPVEDICEFIQSRHRNKTGIIYCLGRDKCEQVAKALRDKGLKAQHYHAKLDPADKERVMRDWQADKVLIIVATVSSISVFPCYAIHRLTLP